jgi:hypothetical protein
MVNYFLVCGILADKWTSTQNDFAASSASVMSPIAVECCTENFRPRVDPIRTEPLIPVGILPRTNAPAETTSCHSPIGGDNQLKAGHRLREFTSGAIPVRDRGVISRNCQDKSRLGEARLLLYSQFDAL